MCSPRLCSLNRASLLYVARKSSRSFILALPSVSLFVLFCLPLINIRTESKVRDLIRMLFDMISHFHNCIPIDLDNIEHIISYDIGTCQDKDQKMCYSYSGFLIGVFRFLFLTHATAHFLGLDVYNSAIVANTSTR